MRLSLIRLGSKCEIKCTLDNFLKREGRTTSYTRNCLMSNRVKSRHFEVVLLVLVHFRQTDYVTNIFTYIYLSSVILLTLANH